MAARVSGEIMAAGVQLQVTCDFANKANPDVVALKGRIEDASAARPDVARRERAGAAWGTRARPAGPHVCAGPSRRRGHQNHSSE